ncbi:MAG TPA: DNA methyltransferase [Candidatus Aquilonibacter sp.]|nr:DNA methyltransferase [Candidatus Aquilonibacter sp.]
MIQMYREFLAAKKCVAADLGVGIEASAVHPLLKPHQRDTVLWAVRGGRRAIFAKFGLGKTFMQIEAVRLTLEKVGGRGLIVLPLGVRQEFRRDAEKLGVPVTFVRSIAECGETGIYLTNYETVRDGKLDPAQFTVASLDEASVLRGFGGTKTFREFMRLFEPVPYRFVATATPSPNDYIEILAYSAFLGIMDVGEAKTRFFKRNSEKADELTIHPHKEREFWLWVASWALFLQQPSDLGYSDEGYALPPMKVIYHEVAVDHSQAQIETSGQVALMRSASLGVVDAAREKRDTLAARVAKMQEILAASPADSFLLWHDLEAERAAIEQAIPASVSVYGSQDLDEREQAILDFSDGKIQYLAAKPVIAGSGCNFQRHCHKAIFVGIGFKFNDFIQAIHRIYRFLQTEEVEIHIIHAESERKVLELLQAKWAKHEETSRKMSEIIREYGLAKEAMASALERSLGVERVEVSGRGWTAVNNDCVEETARMEENSVDLLVTSIPFSTQYEYTPSYNDFGHTDSNEHFFEQMDFLTPNLLKVMKPGRIAAIHVKDRIVPGGMTGLGFQTVYPFHARCIEHYTKHGFAYMGMKTIVTDVVRENNQTYRLGWTEQCKDGTKMGCGMPEYLLLFRKPPSDTSNSYADNPVVKQKSKYSRSRWQIDAHGFTRSSGERLLTPAELEGLDHAQIFKMFRDYSLNEVYSFEQHVKLGEALEAKGILPVTFMLLQPQSHNDEVWSDVTRMRTLNGAQHAKGKEMHLCPLQFDIVDRVIEQFSMEGELVFDPFGGLMTVPYRALLKNRRGMGVELNPAYFLDGCAYLKAAEQEKEMPSLFSLMSDEVRDGEAA